MRIRRRFPAFALEILVIQIRALAQSTRCFPAATGRDSPEVLLIIHRQLEYKVTDGVAYP